jgi:hypothetical protein
VDKLTFPDQQQDLQNAAEFSLASECGGSVKFARQAEEADSGAIRLPDGVWVGWWFQMCETAFVATAKASAMSGGKPCLETEH